jgi:TolB-like protein
MTKLRLFAVLLLAGTGLFAQNVSLDQAIQTSTKAIETGLPKGAKTAVLTFTSAKQAFSDYIIEELATALAANKILQLIDRQHIAAIRKEFNIQFSGDVSDEEVKSIGKQLGAQFVVTGSLVDVGNAFRFRVAAINIETAVREGSSSLYININDPQVVFLLTGQRPAPVVTTPSKSEAYKIGDKGPGGGLIFFAESGVYMECSMDIGNYNWKDAIETAKKHSGGGFSDWRLPTHGELELMRRNLHRNSLGGFSKSNYWTSEQYDRNEAWTIHFNTGKSNIEKKNRTYTVRAVRQFQK